MKTKNYVKYLAPEELYLIIVILYLINLNKLNKILLTINFDRNSDLLLYDSGKPLWYFVFALIAFLIGLRLIWYRLNKKWDTDGIRYPLMVDIIAIVVVTICIMQIFIFINNPILRAVIAVGSFGFVIKYSLK